MSDNHQDREANKTDLFKKKNFYQRPESSVLLCLVILIVLMGIFKTDTFLSVSNFFNMLKGMSSVGIMAIGMTLIIITAGIDLSVGSIMAVSTMATARLLAEGFHPVLALLGGFGIGVLLGVINGLIITKIKVNPFITTLGMLSMGRGLAYFLTIVATEKSVASNISIDNAFILFIGGAYLGPIPVQVIIMLVLVVISSFLLNYTVLGRQIYAVGSNEEAARLSGVNVTKVKVFVYATCGALCALAGLIEAGMLSTAATSAGMGIELDVIAAVVIGGASLMGGRGSIWGAILGAAIIAVIHNSFVQLRLPSYVQTITIGAVIILAVSLDQLRGKTK